MGRKNESRGRPRIDADVKAACLEGLLAGERVRDIAASFGVTPQGLGKARKRDPVFDAGWRAACAASAAAERRSCAIPDGETRIVPNNRRGLQRRKMRHVKFDEKRQEAFLAHFAWSGDTLAAAAEAGVSESTVYTHRCKNPAFAAEYQEALEQGYVRLEAEALRQRIEAQRRLRDALESSEPDAAPVPADIAAEFERVMKLLARWDRKARRPDGQASPGARRVWTFEAAIALLDKRLEALAMAVPPLPPEVAARYDGPAESGEAEAGGPA